MRSHLRRRDLLKGFAVLLPLRSLLADTWPQFRGAGARGIGPDDPHLPETWSSTENVLWSVDIPGTGWASPVVWNDTIFIHTNVNAVGEGTAHKGMSGGRIQYYPPKDEHRSLALSIDFKTGKTRWTTEQHRRCVHGIAGHRQREFDTPDIHEAVSDQPPIGVYGFALKPRRGARRTRGKKSPEGAMEADRGFTKHPAPLPLISAPQFFNHRKEEGFIEPVPFSSRFL
jgi:hypothetical protein